MAGVIRGRVTDPNGRGVPGARVYYRAGPESLPDIAGLTDPTGDFALAAPADGHYVVESAAEGFEPRSVELDFEGTEATIEVRLGPEPEARPGTRGPLAS
jgi:hypothetical protein